MAAAEAVLHDGADFKKVGFVLLRGYLSAEEVETLTTECDRARRLYPNVENNVDPFGRAGVPRDSPARRERWAYRLLRRAVFQSPKETAQGWRAEAIVLDRLGAAACAFKAWRRARLLSEVYVVKEAGSTAFAWHRDDARQLQMVGGAQAEEKSCAFVSTWTPLDDVHAANGTIVLRPLDGTAEVEIVASRGDVLVFDRSLWHSSSASPTTRRVHYAQFSRRAIYWEGHPLWMAVPVLPVGSPRTTLCRINDLGILENGSCEDRPVLFRGAAARHSAAFDDLRQRAAADPEVGARVAGTVFMSSQPLFYLDGTRHPRALLTRLTAKDDQRLRDLLTTGRKRKVDAALRYSVFDDISDEDWEQLGLPLEPPSLIKGKHRRRQLFLSDGPTSTQVHRDAYDNVYCCLHGRRSWRLAHPEHSPWLEREPGAVSATEEAGGDDLTRELRAAVRYHTVHLEAADVLFVPKGWWHAVDAAGGLSAAASWYYDHPETTGDSEDEEPLPPTSGAPS